MGDHRNAYELEAWSKNQVVLGLDEAGRGPMAGPLLVAGVVFPKGFHHEAINDSKKLSEKKRLELEELIKSEAVWYWIETISVEAIDELNIYQATRLGMQKIADEAPADLILSDAMPLEAKDSKKTYLSLIKGDQKSISIAAASILAKNARDRIMIEYDALYPEYGFARHKGYGTQAHKEAVLKHGRLAIHRNSFRFKDEDQISFDI